MKKYGLVLSVLYLIIAAFSAYGQYEIDAIDTDVYSRHYNSLPSVEESDAALKLSPQFSSFLQNAGEIVINHELEPYIGLRLIHRHFTTGLDEIMVEEY
jgi:hypothetical protein